MTITQNGVTRKWSVLVMKDFVPSGKSRLLLKYSLQKTENSGWRKYSYRQKDQQKFQIVSGKTEELRDFIQYWKK